MTEMDDKITAHMNHESLSYLSMYDFTCAYKKGAMNKIHWPAHSTPTSHLSSMSRRDT